MAAAPISRQSIKAPSGALSSRRRNRTKSTEDNRIEDVEPIKKRLTMLLEGKRRPQATSLSAGVAG
jgi:hypothetical protein